MPFTSLAEAYFIGAMMILILIVSFAAVFFFFRQLKREKGDAQKLKDFKAKEKSKKENAEN